MADAPFSAFLSGLVDAALDAGREILDVYAAPIEVTKKADASPVTEADERAERVILAKLATLVADVPVVAEESVAAGRIPATAARFILVDPLDGTKEFISKNGEFTVNIALVEDGVPVAGVVYAPALGRMFVGDRNGAWSAAVTEGTLGAFQPIRVRSVPADGLVVVGSRSHGSPETDAYVARFKVAEYRSAGSSLKFCLVAAGEADLYPRFGRTMEWDTAAGDAVLRAAGGAMVNPDGTAFVYGKRNQVNDSDFANGPFVAASTMSLVKG
jgi:3'(2'), 5'-bisphosphate nucleotidase